MSRARAAGQAAGGIIAMTVGSAAVGGWLMGALSIIEAAGIVAGYFAAMFVFAVVAGLVMGAVSR
ncbi:hypothetical protein J2754_001572 [Halarchaeum solikamskense]|uniref:hypothetical protein n=1 Tax=Halarchaeum nitratireducens TaxID=489913 RepID=UPI001B3AA6C9|nr:hypothetical protein [Halarchaeum solikamskense]MBP2251251.1 hypothetical protein [Halarchaeum solikamskense]